eukprot:SAG22_NODE_6887_length_798_cov_1.935622_2_plen_69_part_00
MLHYNGVFTGPGPKFGLTKQSPLDGGIRAVLRPGETMFWVGGRLLAVPPSPPQTLPFCSFEARPLFSV